MHRDENDNEDLMTEAVSLVERIEIRCSNRRDLVVVGANAIGWLFAYFGSDPMYRFDEQGRLRRAFVDGILFRTSGQTLTRLERTKNETLDDSNFKSESIVLTRELTRNELQRFRERMFSDLNDLRHGLRYGEITRQHPVDTLGLVPKFEIKVQNVLESPDFLAPVIVRR